MPNSSKTNPHYVLLRDDDTNALTDPDCLERLYRPFLDRDLPVNLSVIPEVSTTACRKDGMLEEFLNGQADLREDRIWIGQNRHLGVYLRQNPGYHIVQHGFDHSYHEFAIHDRAEIARRLDRGAASLLEAGFPKPHTFVAPHDHISRECFTELTSRYRVVSTGWFEWKRVPTRWWPAYLHKKATRQLHWRAGKTLFLSHPGCLLSRFRDREKMFEAVRHLVASQRLTVLVTHWWEYFEGGKPDEPFIDTLHQTAEFLASDPNIYVLSFTDLARDGFPKTAGWTSPPFRNSSDLVRTPAPMTG